MRPGSIVSIRGIRLGEVRPEGAEVEVGIGEEGAMAVEPVEEEGLGAVESARSGIWPVMGVEP